MRALITAVIYFGTFLTLGWLARRLLDRTLRRRGESLDERQPETSTPPTDRFLLGVWYKGR